ncbi:hypothetical protein [Paenarthrobacter nicotinovorans]|uniref:hypothetical protein n=1 Tax=Paenarthrobacter nicotinovorans TaxID=29320 RepID=UPI00164285FC|nr:hypothetical protein [Paenarthrobacter nicotinovorans]
MKRHDTTADLAPLIEDAAQTLGVSPDLSTREIEDIWDTAESMVAESIELPAP